MMCNLYFNSAKHVLPFVSNYLSYKPYSHTLEALNLPHSDGKIVVGFVSKFLVINHAHGQLLEGIVQHLDRKYFLYCCIGNSKSTKCIVAIYCQ